MHAIKEQSELEAQKRRRSIEEESVRDKALFSTHTVAHPITIRIRLAKKTITKEFDLADPIQALYRYVNGFLRSYFEDPHAEFDLLEIPSDSLARVMEERMGAVWGV